MAGEEKNQRGKSQEKLMDSGGLTGEVLQLINKYVGGRIPILVDTKDPKRGLVNGGLLKIYQKGFVENNLIPLGFLLARKDCADKEAKWGRDNADYRLNDWARSSWINVCQAIRSPEKKRGDEECERCDRRWAKRAEEVGDVVAYMCVHGIVDFAMPIFVEDEVIAVIFTGQRVPKEGTFWNREFVEKNGVFSLHGSKESGVDARQVTLERFKNAEEKYDLGTGTLVGKLEEDVKESERVEVTPEDVASIQKALQTAGEQLSKLAQSTYELEKSKAVAALRSRIARSVAGVEVDVERVAETLPSVVEGISKAAGLICKYFGIDYMLVLNTKAEKSSFRILLEHTPEQMPWARGVWAEELEEESFTKLEGAFLKVSELDNSDLWPLRKLPFFDWVATWLRGKQASRCVAVRLDRPGLPPCVLLAGRKIGLRLSDFLEQDRIDFSRVISDITTVINVLLFIDELHSAGETQDVFLEDVAHDIRNPIQNILIKVERLKLGLVQTDEVLNEVGRLGAQIRRIHQLSQKVWVLEQFRQGRLELDKAGLVRVHQVIMEVVGTLEDTAKEKSLTKKIEEEMKEWRAIRIKDKNLTIKIAVEIEGWRAIRIDHDLFFHAMLNLVDNATKYSSEGTEIRIDGEMKLYPKCRISVVNRGVEIKEKYRDKILKRGFRTPEAKMHIWQGSGLGLCMVKAFADFYEGDIEVKCNPVPGSSDFVTEFRLIFTGAIL